MQAYGVEFKTSTADKAAPESAPDSAQSSDAAQDTVNSTYTEYTNGHNSTNGVPEQTL